MGHAPRSPMKMGLDMDMGGGMGPCAGVTHPSAQERGRARKAREVAGMPAAALAGACQRRDGGGRWTSMTMTGSTLYLDAHHGRGIARARIPGESPRPMW